MVSYINNDGEQSCDLHILGVMHIVGSTISACQGCMRIKTAGQIVFQHYHSTGWIQ